MWHDTLLLSEEEVGWVLASKSRLLYRLQATKTPASLLVAAVCLGRRPVGVGGPTTALSAVAAPVSAGIYSGRRLPVSSSAPQSFHPRWR